MRSFEDYKNEAADDPYYWGPEKPSYDKHSYDPDTRQVNVSKVQAQTADPEEHLDMAIDQLVGNLTKMIKKAMPTKHDQPVGVLGGIKKWWDDWGKHGRAMHRRELSRKGMDNRHLGGRYAGLGEPDDIPESTMPLSIYNFFTEASSHIEETLAEARMEHPLDNPDAPVSNLVGTAHQHKIGNPTNYLVNYLNNSFKVDLRKILDDYLTKQGQEVTKPYLKHHQELKGGTSLLKPSISDEEGSAPKGSPASAPSGMTRDEFKAKMLKPIAQSGKDAVDISIDAYEKHNRGEESGMTDPSDATSHPAGTPKRSYGKDDHDSAPSQEDVDKINSAPEDEKLQVFKDFIGGDISDEKAKEYLASYEYLVKQGSIPVQALEILKLTIGNTGTPRPMEQDGELSKYRKMLREQDLKNYTPHPRRSYVDRLPSEFKTNYYTDLLKEVEK